MAEQNGNEIQMNAANLYREENYTDLRAGSLRKLIPVKPDGTDDPSRPVIFTAATQVMTPGGILPLSGEVPNAKTLAEAVAGFAPAIKQGLADLREEMAALQRERASQIVVPGRDVPPPSDLLIR
ncbi:MAG TPA: hypothetical protein PLT37_02945 [Kiritimatiellia bacterium]|jgi:hypothetical protein|nr:hypothetical protein [Kiritimatiellia bacterium]OQC59873.1 MAG: hypothetical protein BWX54_00449 [Verrucomicrobia bacterium ADurb.Bin018]MBP9571804.1 hypothetical protein [Kiritimatiellia bacterium]HQF20188.1 hypothetical protein [Kiritimatiellia bacterium]HQG74978.1 hypothetical protein [Kiritimatiellia bacterium]